MNCIFEIADKSERKIHLSKERLSHILKHKEMSKKIEDIKEVLKNPDVITTFEYDKDMKSYYKYHKERK